MTQNLRSSRRRSTSLAATATAACALAATTPAALAGPYEQVTRASGAQGAATFTGSNQPVAVSDSGRYAVYSPRPFSQPVKIPVILRHTVTNKSTTLNPNATVIGFDKNEKTFATVEPNAAGDASAVWVRPTAGGPSRKVVDLDPFASASYAFSGDGSVIAVAEEWGALKLYDVATGAVLRTVEDSGLALNARSLSDDGAIVAGTKNWSGGFYLKADGTLVDLAQPAVVSPDGSVVVTSGDPFTPVTVTKTADGTTQSFPAERSGILWVAPDGSAMAAGDNDTEGGGALRLDFATGTWSKFGGAFTSDLDGNLVDPVNSTQSAVSRNGQYGLVQYAKGLSNQLAVTRFDGKDLPGTQEPLSASSYVPFAPPISFSCSTQPEANLIGVFRRPASWAPLPRLGNVQVRVDGKTVFNKTFTKPFDVNDPTSTPATISVPFSTSAKSIRVSALVLDDKFRPLADTEVTAPICVGGFGSE